jgi:hypothetical protein
MVDLPAGAPDRATLERQLRDNSHAELAKTYGVSRQTIGYWAQRAGLSRSNNSMSHKDILPWAIKAEDHHDGIARALRWLNKREKGGELGAVEQREVERLTAFLESENVVVDYDRSRGFIFRRRNPAVDAPNDVIRRPASV